MLFPQERRNTVISFIFIKPIIIIVIKIHVYIYVYVDISFCNFYFTGIFKVHLLYSKSDRISIFKDTFFSLCDNDVVYRYISVVDKYFACLS